MGLDASAKSRRLKSALSAVASYAALKDAWHTVFQRARPASRNTRGIDGISLNDFAVDYKAKLRLLGNELSRGEFTFGALRPHLIPKANGKDRLICVPTVRDRIVQRTLLDLLTKKYLTRISNDISYGFVKNRTVRDAAERACDLREKLPWVFKTDITSFFDRIERGALMKAATRIVRERSLHAMFASAANCEIAATSGGAAKRIAKLGIKEGLGVRQGMPLSPFFANIILDSFDRAVITAGYAAVRYADDLIFFAADQDACHQVHKFCKSELARLGLEIPDIA